jgi:hypothetical protein
MTSPWFWRARPDERVSRTTKNKFQKSGMFFEANLTVVNSPRFTTRPPRFYHPKTTPKHALFAKPPSKRPAKPYKKASTRPPDFFLQITAFSE